MTRVPSESGAGSPRGPDRIAAVTKPGADFISEPKVPGEHKWVELADDRRTLSLYGGPITEPVRTLSRQGWDAFELLSTERALADVPEVGDAAGRVHLVAGLPVDEAAAVIVDDVGSGRLVALGGGRVIDSAKAASATGAEAAIPTTCSVRRSPASTACLRAEEKRPASSGRLWSWPTPTP